MSLLLLLISRSIVVNAQGQNAQDAFSSYMQNPTMSSLQSQLEAQTALSDRNSVSSIINNMIESFVVTYSEASTPSNGAMGPTPGPTPATTTGLASQNASPMYSGLMTDSNSFVSTTSDDSSPDAGASDPAPQGNSDIFASELNSPYASISPTNTPFADPNSALYPSSYSTTDSSFYSPSSSAASGILSGGLLTDTSSSTVQFATGVSDSTQFSFVDSTVIPTGFSTAMPDLSSSSLGSDSLLGLNSAAYPTSSSTAGSPLFSLTSPATSAGIFSGGLLTDTSSSSEQYITGLHNSNGFAFESTSTPSVPTFGTNSLLSAASLPDYSSDSNGINSGLVPSSTDSPSTDVFNNPSIVSLSQLFLTATDTAVQQSALSAINGLYSTLNGQTGGSQDTGPQPTTPAQPTTPVQPITPALNTSSLSSNTFGAESAFETGAAFTDSTSASSNTSSTPAYSSVGDNTSDATPLVSFSSSSVFGGSSNSSLQPLVFPNAGQALHISTIGFLLGVAAMCM